MAVFQVVATCSLVEVYRRFRCAWCLHHQSNDLIEAASTSETSVNSYQTTQRNKTEDRHLQKLLIWNFGWDGKIRRFVRMYEKAADWHEDHGKSR
jgi:hypothetical protein